MCKSCSSECWLSQTPPDYCTGSWTVLPFPQTCSTSTAISLHCHMTCPKILSIQKQTSQDGTAHCKMDIVWPTTLPQTFSYKMRLSPQSPSRNRLTSCLCYKCSSEWHIRGCSKPRPVQLLAY